MNRPSATAIVTASYSRDFERCRLLCDSIDGRLSGFSHHYILVASHDMTLFRELQTPQRTVVDERELLPAWLYAIRDPLSLFSRHLWLSFRTAPLRGWHVQQLRRLAIARHIEADAFFYCDSDIVFLKPFESASLWRDGKMRFLRRENALGREELFKQRLWSRNAAIALGIERAKLSSSDYIASAIAWRRDTMLAMLKRIEEIHNRHWIAVVASTREFSECMLYGRYVDDLLGGEGHFATNTGLCRIYWGGPSLGYDELASFAAGMTPDEVAIGIQSFVGTETRIIRRLFESA